VHDLPFARTRRGTWLAAGKDAARICRRNERRRLIVVKHTLPAQRRIEDRLRKRYDERWQDVRREPEKHDRHVDELQAEHARGRTPSP
jgi:hypothetical protein